MYYHTMHSPRGAGASFVLGALNEAGGFMQNHGFIPENDVYIGILDNGVLRCLPFFKEEDAADAEESFDIGNTVKRRVKLRKYPKEEVTRTLGLATDCFETKDLSFTLYTPAAGIPDPDCSDYEAVKRAVTPSICASFTVINDRPRPITGFFSVQGMRGLYPLSQTCKGRLLGAVCMDGYGFSIDSRYADICEEIADFSPASALSRTRRGFYRNCEMGGFCFNVAANSTVTVDFSLGFFLPGAQTRGAHSMPYYYTRYFSSIEQVLEYSAEQLPFYKEQAQKLDSEFSRSSLSQERKFFIAQSVHCYWASSMLFDEGGCPRYVVNEGSYMMMNTFDLSVDHLFFECASQPWSVKNQLDSFRHEYSYSDTLHGFIGDELKSGLPGGITFTHDQGSYGTFSPKGYSSYEMTDKNGCLSYMSQEQLLNFILSAAVYTEAAKDECWRRELLGTVRECLDSMCNRDHPDEALRDGIMDFDGDRCGLEGEITTYDSLDEGLGQARRNLYLAVKSWAGYLAIARMADGLDSNTGDRALAAADRAAKTIVSCFDEKLGFIPAILDGRSQTAIIPAIEGLSYPYFFGFRGLLNENGRYGALISILKRHLKGVLVPELCVFEDGGWRLSSGSTNSWMSKIFLCEFIAEEILGMSIENANGHPDKAQLRWWQEQCARCPGIDQVVYGQPYSRGFHYPRAVTSVLWLKENMNMLNERREL